MPSDPALRRARRTARNQRLSVNQGPPETDPERHQPSSDSEHESLPLQHQDLFEEADEPAVETFHAPSDEEDLISDVEIDDIPVEEPLDRAERLRRVCFEKKHPALNGRRYSQGS